MGQNFVSLLSHVCPKFTLFSKLTYLEMIYVFRGIASGHLAFTPGINVLTSGVSEILQVALRENCLKLSPIVEERF